MQIIKALKFEYTSDEIYSALRIKISNKLYLKMKI